MKKKLLVHGARGRVGKLITELVSTDAEWRKCFELVERNPQFVIDFSSPDGALKAAEIAAAARAPLLIGTTGLDPEHFKRLEQMLVEVAWAAVPNTSMGVYALFTALKSLDRLLPKSMEASIFEVHHGAKKDAPSGTALLLAKALSRPAQIASARGGSEVGEHRVMFFGQGERLELVHNASSRVLFAHGALRLAQRLLASSKKGRHELDELYA